MHLTLRRFTRVLWQQWIRPLALPLLLVASAKSAIADINFVPTGSMKPTILEGDVVFINKLAYDLRVPFTFTRLAKWSEPARGDVVVCYSPADGMRLVKRVIGLPGDVVELRNEVLWINGAAQGYAPWRATAASEETRTAEGGATLFARETLTGGRAHAVMALPERPALRTFGPVVVPTGSYFMLGDNRDNSGDSRFFGFVPRQQITGEVKGVFVSANTSRWLRPRFDRFFNGLD